MPPNWFVSRKGASVRPAASSRLLREFQPSRLANQEAEPWKALVPLLVTTFMTEPAARPYSAVNWLVTRRISWTMSVMLMGCVRPVTLGSLLSWPSIMKLLDRTRPPLTAKLVPAAKPVWPDPSWLTPGAESASAYTSRWLETGSSATRLVSKRTPTSALVVLSRGASDWTVIVSVSVAGFSITSITASWLTARVTPERT